MNALLTGQVDVINNVDFKTETLLNANPNTQLFEVTGNQHYTFPMHVDAAPFNDLNVRKALKYAINRQEMVDKILQGHGSVGNDSPIGRQTSISMPTCRRRAMTPTRPPST